MDDQETANTLLQLDVVTSRVRDHLKLMSGKQTATSKDVHNLCQVASSSDTTEDELLKVLENCIGNDPTCTVSLIINEDDELELLYIQTSRMKQTARNFPGVLLMDSTYRCNNRKVPLSTMMAMDGNGDGQVVAYALLRNERQETLRLFLSNFKELNSATTQTKLFIVDKDFIEVAVLRELWPDAEVFLCLFHILKSLKQDCQPCNFSRKERKKQKRE